MFSDLPGTIDINLQEILQRIHETSLSETPRPSYQKDIGSIIDLLMKDLQKRLEAKQISLELTDRGKQLIIDEAYDPIYGARPLKRYLQSHVETMLGRKIIAGEIGSAAQNGEGCRAQIDAENGELGVR